jgi:uncharacterized membrane protein (UPF0127 family)
MKFIHLHNTTRPSSPPIRAKYCRSFFDRFKGLMLQKEIGEQEGLLLVQERESRLDSSIHMLFMNFDIAAIWLDKELVVVGKTLARKWALSYFPPNPAQYVLETHPDRLSDFEPGDVLKLSYDE